MSWNPFSILRNDEPAKPAETDAGALADATERIADMVGATDVLVFMKGRPEAPMCGYSANTIAILQSYGIPFSTFNVLANPDIREAAKVYGDWPTFPQVYVRGELIGGDDIVTEMHASSELGAVLEGSSS